MGSSVSEATYQRISRLADQDRDCRFSFRCTSPADMLVRFPGNAQGQGKGVLRACKRHARVAVTAHGGPGGLTAEPMLPNVHDHGEPGPVTGHGIGWSHAQSYGPCRRPEADPPVDIQATLTTIAGMRAFTRYEAWLATTFPGTELHRLGTERLNAEGN